MNVARVSLGHRRPMRKSETAQARRVSTKNGKDKHKKDAGSSMGKWQRGQQWQ